MILDLTFVLLSLVAPEPCDAPHPATAPDAAANSVPTPSESASVTLSLTTLLQGDTVLTFQSADDSDWPPPGVPDDLDPIYFFKTGCPHQLTLVNWTHCVLYFRTFLDCDGDGVVDSMNEHFVPPIDWKTGVPWVVNIEPKEDCQILYWGLFDLIGDCDPGWLQDPYFPCAVHFL